MRRLSKNLVDGPVALFHQVKETPQGAERHLLVIEP